MNIPNTIQSIYDTLALALADPANHSSKESLTLVALNDAFVVGYQESQRHNQPGASPASRASKASLLLLLGRICIHPGNQRDTLGHALVEYFLNHEDAPAIPEGLGIWTSQVGKRTMVTLMDIDFEGSAELRAAELWAGRKTVEALDQIADEMLLLSEVRR